MRMPLSGLAALGLHCLASCPFAHAQQIKADTGGVAIGGNVSGSTINIGIPLEQLAALVRQAGDLSEAQKKLIARLEGDLDLNQRQIHAALEVLGEKDVPPERLGIKLVEIAERIKVLQATASARPGDDPRIAALKAEAQKAIGAGELAKADATLADVEAEQGRMLDILAVNVADISARRGEIALTRLRYAEAARHFAHAAAVLPQAGADQDKRLGYLGREAYAFYHQGVEFGDKSALLAAVDRSKRLVALTDREHQPLVWATNQDSLGIALLGLGERESGRARLDEAVDAFREALKERTRDRAPLEWAETQNDLGIVLIELGGRESGTAALEEAVATYREALKEWSRDQVPLNWAVAQNNLGNALVGLGERQNGTDNLNEAIAAYREAMKVWTRDRTPAYWAATQTSLCIALGILGERESGTARFEEAVAACREALKERTRERLPLDWAITQRSLGNALLGLGEREGDTTRLKEAVAIYREALEEQTRDRTPLDWARTQQNLGIALWRLGMKENDTASLEDAVRADREALTQRTRDDAPLDWVATQQNLGVALRSLGYVYFYKGEFEAAARNLEQAIDGTSAYPILWLYLARARAGEHEARNDFERSAGRLKEGEWPSPVIKLFLEQITPEAMLAAASKPSQRCEAEYYLGQWYLLRAASANSTAALRHAVEECPKTYIEYAGAVAELKRLGQ